jgi:alpha-glucosidase
VAFEDLQDPFGKAHWPRDKGRDGCRTPMPWAADAPAAGFSAGRPWLPADAAHRQLAVDRQQDDPHSCLNLTRRLLALRRRHAALRVGGFQALHADDTLLIFLRRHDGDAVLAAFNLGTEPATHELSRPPVAVGEALALNGAKLDGRYLQLPPGAAFVLAVSATDDAGTAHP